MLAAWMLRLPERMDHEQRLMPYLLSALNDESPQIQVGGGGLKPIISSRARSFIVLLRQLCC